MAEHKKSNDETAKTHTAPFGADQAKREEKKPQNQEKSELRIQAERAVKSQHGEHVDRNQNYEQLVKDAEQQISGASEQNKDM